MANEYEFGGTNGVEVADFGQIGGTLQVAGYASWIPQHPSSAPDIVRVENPLPQQAAVFADVVGFAGQRWTFAGPLRVDTRARLATIESTLSQYHSGQTITAGVRGAPSATKLAPTRLRDGWGTILSENAILETYDISDWRTIQNTQGFTLRVILSITYLGLK